MLQDGERPRLYSRDEMAERNAKKHWLEKAAESVIGSIIWMAIMFGCIFMVLASMGSCAAMLS